MLHEISAKDKNLGDPLIDKSHGSLNATTFSGFQTLYLDADPSDSCLPWT
jgi:hypothetical protein